MSNRQKTTLVLASARIIRQLPAQWLAAFVFMLVVSIGAVLRPSIDGDTARLLTLFSGAIFIPSPALTGGVRSRTGKLFETVYILIWYLGPLNQVHALDDIKSHRNGRPGFFIPVSIALIAAAALGRARQIRN